MQVGICAGGEGGKGRRGHALTQLHAQGRAAVCAACGVYQIREAGRGMLVGFGRADAAGTPRVVLCTGLGTGALQKGWGREGVCICTTQAPGFKEINNTYGCSNKLLICPAV
jgi:hypothetical protein